MHDKQTSIWSNGLIWFGAAVSIAEIFTGAIIAPLGFGLGMAAILLGHLIGGVLMYLAGYIGAKTGKSAMDTVKISFGERGGALFSSLNVLQLIGWTAVMIISGARATAVLANPLFNTEGDRLWAVVIGLLIIIWILIGIKNLGKINVIAVGGLFLSTIVMSTVVFKGGQALAQPGFMSFGAAVELSAAMPLSWMPLISDYTRNAKNPKAATAVSTIAYFTGSVWMYAIGLGAALYVGGADIAAIMMAAGLGAVGIFITVASTVTTTFLDAYSAGVSTNSIWRKASEKWVAVAVAATGTALAIFTPIEQFENFLYLIGSVFAPMASILIVDFFVLEKEGSESPINFLNFIIWLSGFALYRVLISLDSPVGSTLPVIAATALLCIIINGGKRHCLKK